MSYLVDTTGRPLSGERSDGWQNQLTGLGSLAKDKRTNSAFGAAPKLSWKELEELFAGDELARRVVMKPAGDMTRQWFRMSDPELDEGVQSYIKRLRAKRYIKQGLVFGKLYGGALAILGIDDGQEMDQPVNESSIRSIRWMHVLHRYNLRAARVNTNPDTDGFNEPDLYEIIPSSRTGMLIHATSQQRFVHSSRVLMFGGVMTPQERRLYNDGWDDSVFVSIYDCLRDFQATWGGVNGLMQDFAQAVYKIKGLKQMVSSQGEDTLAKRFAIMDASRSILNAVAIDADAEEFRRETVTLTGVADILDRGEYRMSVAADMPVSVLFGRSPAGMNATGEHDLDNYYDQIRAKQEEDLDPCAERLISLVLLAQDGPKLGKGAEEWSHKWNPLKQQSEEKIVETRLKQAQADDIYMTQQVLSPDEVRGSRFEGVEYSIETSVEAIDAPIASSEFDGDDPSDSNANPDIRTDPDQAVDPKTALNGAQVKSLTDIVAAVARGEIPRESGVAMIEFAFPLSADQAESIMSSVGNGFDPKSQEPAVPNQGVQVPDLDDDDDEDVDE